MPNSILIFDESKENATSLIQLLNKHRFHSKLQTDTPKLLQTLNKGDFLLIINDSECKLLDDIEYLEKIRSTHARLPIIIISDQSDPVILSKVAKTGVSLILESKYEATILINTLNEFITSNDTPFTSLTSTPTLISTETPHPKLKHLAGKSPNSKRSIQTLWNSFQTNNHIFVFAPTGSEIELLLAELSEWSQHPNRRTLWIQADQVATPETKQILDRLHTQEKFSSVVGINDLAITPPAYQEALLKFIKEDFEKIHQSSSLTLVYSVESSQIKNIIPGLLNFSQERFITLPPLSQRLADLATYITNLGKKHSNSCIEWTPQAIRALLEHSWPNNYFELDKVLKKVANKKQTGLTNASSIYNCINLPLKDNESYPSIQTLEQFLVEKKN